MSEAERVTYTIARFGGVPCAELLSRGSCGRTFDAALIYTPDICLVARVASDGFVLPNGDGEAPPVDLASAYEVRAFGQDAELRWVRNGASGEATLLADGAVDAPNASEIGNGETLDVLERHYRVWSLAPSDRTAARPPVPSGWVAVGNGRIGTIRVPLSGATEPVHEVNLFAREYVVRGEHGNAVVLFERLVGFAPADDRERDGKGGNDV